MSGISFRYRKTERAIDAGFSLYNGKQMVSAGHWMVGDKIGVCFDGQAEIARAVKLSDQSTIGYLPSDGFIHVPCVVVSRSHSVVWRAVGQLHQLTDSNVTLEAETGEWEDVLLWIVKGVKPEWVMDDSEK